MAEAPIRPQGRRDGSGADRPRLSVSMTDGQRTWIIRRGTKEGISDAQVVRDLIDRAIALEEAA